MSATLQQEAPTGIWLEIVRDKVEGLRYGSVQIVVHEGRVTQVESTEKTRFTESAASPAPSQRKAV